MSVLLSTVKRSTATPSGRKGSAKVRSGCITCKARKVKCDEVKPSCLRCIKSARSCDGYLDPSVMASRRKSTRTNKSVETGSLYSPLVTLLDGALPEEKRSFHFFQHVTAPHLAGDLDALFWKVLVLQVCQTEPSVRHAVLAVSSLHEYLTHSPGKTILQREMPPTTAKRLDSEPQHSFVLHQYNKAIACLISQMKDTTSKPLAPLLTCVLFVCLEFMHGKDRESLIHLEQGRQLLSRLDQRANSKDPEIHIVKQHLVPLYLRLSLTAFLFGGKPVPIPQSLKSLKEVPVTFESVQEIRFSLYDFMDEVLRYLQRARIARYEPGGVAPETFTELEGEKEDLLQRLSNLSVAFSLYQTINPSQTSEVNAAMFHMYLHIMTIWVSTALSNTEACFDDHLPSFVAIIPHATTILNHSDYPPADFSLIGRERLMQARSRERTPRRQSSMFTFETYVIPVLYYVATKCRHPLIRHSALDLLKQNPNRRENLWHSKKMAAIAEHVVRVEEESAAGSKPASPVGQDPVASGPDPLTQSRPPVPIVLGEEGSQTSELATGYGDMLSFNDTFSSSQMMVAGLESSSSAGDDYPGHNVGTSHALQCQPIIRTQGGALTGLENPAPPVEPAIIATMGVDVDSSYSAQGPYMSQNEAAVLTSLGRSNITGSNNSSRRSVTLGDTAEAFRFLTPSQHQQHLNSCPPSRIPSFVNYSQAEDCPYGYEQYRQQQRPISTSSGSDASASPNMQALVFFESSLTASSHLQQQQKEILSAPAPARNFSSLKAPFDIPENIRVHTVIVNTEKDDGSWLTVFRKLHGPAAEWHVETDLVVA